MKRILVTGITGTLGRPVAGVLRSLGADVRGLSRRPGQDFQGDLADGSGLDAALSGVDAVVHCASDTRRLGRGDVQGLRNLLAAAGRAGRPHVLFVSIVGVDVIPYPYYRVKLAAEGLVEGYGGTILRATQFHEFVFGAARIVARMPVVLAPDMPVQPISTRDVARRIAEILDDPPAGRVADLGGPEVLRAPDMVRDYLRATGRDRRTIPARLPGATFRGFRQGAHLAPSHRSAGERWAEFLEARVRGG
ncbi:SDR family oxidoreductase [Actinoplanes flavus]|uniref:NAD(P)H-binding protein n=1 Tax=Actinoplanes flavus TaxID=2820290 RepID=A0ABS3UK89_9ACTN|nr:NAD(P)H-binding protein [Actinoplanes flavus]MBO3739200.1 NAD(P)H-binding protein [Actinoplanes flavus]